MDIDNLRILMRLMKDLDRSLHGIERNIMRDKIMAEMYEAQARSHGRALLAVLRRLYGDKE
jgi:hypothetical protein